MKRPLLLIFFLATISLFVSLYIISYLPPKNWQIITLFLISAFFAISSTITFISTITILHFSDPHINKQKSFQENLRRGILISLAIIGLGTLKVLWALNPLNAILLITIIILIELYFTKYRNID